MSKRAEHLQWCKDRALVYVGLGDLNGAFSSMVSDLSNCPEGTDYSAVNGLGMQMLMSGLLGSPGRCVIGSMDIIRSGMICTLTTGLMILRWRDSKGRTTQAMSPQGHIQGGVPTVVLGTFGTTT